MNQWDFASVFANTDALLAGAAGTVRIFAICLVAGVRLRLGVRLRRYLRHPVLYLAATGLLGILPHMPVPVLLPFSIDPLAAASLGISLNSAAFSAEIYRGGIQSIDRGQWDGARALGMSFVQAMRRIILPQALKRMTPALTNRAIEIFKMSTLASAVAYVELLQQAQLDASPHLNSIQAYSAVAVIFFVFLWPMVQFTYVLERRLKRNE